MDKHPRTLECITLYQDELESLLVVAYRLCEARLRPISESFFSQKEVTDEIKHLIVSARTFSDEAVSTGLTEHEQKFINWCEANRLDTPTTPREAAHLAVHLDNIMNKPEGTSI
jgi:hypothetical protein